ncbi:hypothetical protein F4780DRAFT_615586 [Xylariomycetidae sp. FL0641]|nr:hypothetical protein F4780DRAFT_615586 [Xylariomycetidae sp. FL0641]
MGRLAPQGGDYDVLSSRNRRVEELDSDDTDTQGAELAPVPANRRFPSDPLRFTGIDLGGGSRPRSRYAYQHAEDEDSTEDDSQASSDEDTEDEALVQSALSRIRKAQARGKEEVKLNKEELAALERRRKRLQAEAEAARRGEGNQRRRKEKEPRYAVPLSHFAPSPQPRSRVPSVSDDALPRHPTPSTLAQNQGRPGPPMGLFHPPNAPQARPQSSSRRRDSSPFRYQYVSPPPNQRHASDTTRPSSSRLSLPHEDDWRSQSSRHARDPFQYQTAGPRAPYPHDSAAAGRNASGSSNVAYAYFPRRGASAAAGSSADLTSEEDGDTSSDEQDVVEPPLGPAPVPGSQPERERPKSKKSSPSTSSPVKRKPVSGSGSRRRKGR